ncbi:hypothetical protein [Pedobacter sp. UYP1]|uniref:hypothetical protein n=1 Tax=Pedobacter sp. UYP1 TaxID=1756396 RepID=UPI003394EAFB
MSQKYVHASWNGQSYWHGTSTIFLESIRKTGLGAINPSRDWKLLELLAFLYNEIITLKINNEVFEIHRVSIAAAISQSTLDYGDIKLNFQHDGVYISASSIRAATYACENHVGSELLQKCMVLLSILISTGNEPEIPKELDILQIRQYLSVAAKPIMIEIREVPDSDLLFEDGTDAAEKLSDLRDVFAKLPIPQQFEKLQFYNFRLLKPVQPALLYIYDVDFEGSVKTRDFQFYLTRIR